MDYIHKLPPLLDSPCEGQLELLVSNIQLSPRLDTQQSVDISTTWWGDTTTCCFRVPASDGEAKVSFGVCCDEQSFRQYLQDAQRLCLTVCIASVLEQSSLLPQHLLGTPRHRTLEKCRASWRAGEEVGKCSITNMKLNIRGELVQQCTIKNRFGDDCGTLDITMIYCSNVRCVLSSHLMESNEVLEGDTSADYSSTQLDDVENKENLIIHTVLHSSNQVKLPSSAKDPNNYPGTNRILKCNNFCADNNAVDTNAAHFDRSILPPITSESKVTRSPQKLFIENSSEDHLPSVYTCNGQQTSMHPFTSDSYYTSPSLALSSQHLDTSANYGISASKFTSDGNSEATTVNARSSVSAASAVQPPLYVEASASIEETDCTGLNLMEDFISDDSVLDYLRHVDPQSLIECGALRQEDLPSFLKLVRDYTLDETILNSGGAPLVSLPNSNVQSTMSLSHRDIVSKSVHRSFEPNVPIQTSSTITSVPYSVHDQSSLFTSSTQCCGVLNVKQSVGVAGSLAAAASKFNQRGSTASASKHGFSMRMAEVKRQQCTVDDSEYSGISLSSGVWPLVQDNVGNKDIPYSENHDYHTNVTAKVDNYDESRKTVVHLTKDSDKILYGIDLPVRKALNFKYKAFAPDGKELTMDGKCIARLTNPQAELGLPLETKLPSRVSSTKENRGTSIHEFELKTGGFSNDGASVVSLLSASGYIQDENRHGVLKNAVTTNADEDDVFSVASDETYTTSTINPHTEVLGIGRAGSVLVVEAGELVLQGAVLPTSGGPAASRCNLKGVRDRSNVCLLTTLTVTAPHPHLAYRQDTNDPDLSRDGVERPPGRGDYCVSSPPLQQNDDSAEDGREGDDLQHQQTVTLASRHLHDNSKTPQVGVESYSMSKGALQPLFPQQSCHEVQYEAVEVFDLAGLTAPEQLKQSSLLIRVYKRVLGQQRSEELCCAQLSLWDIYRLVHGPVTIPLAPVPGVITCHPHSQPSHDRHTDPYDGVGLNSDMRLSDLSHAGRSSTKRLVSAVNVRSTAGDRDVALAPAVLRIRGQRTARLQHGRKVLTAKKLENKKTTSGEITLFMKLFLNEQYVDQFMHSIVEDPCVISSFFADYKHQSKHQDQKISSDPVEILTIPPNCNLYDVGHFDQFSNTNVFNSSLTQARLRKSNIKCRNDNVQTGLLAAGAAAGLDKENISQNVKYNEKGNIRNSASENSCFASDDNEISLSDTNSKDLVDDKFCSNLDESNKDGTSIKCIKDIPKNHSISSSDSVVPNSSDEIKVRSAAGSCKLPLSSQEDGSHMPVSSHDLLCLQANNVNDPSVSFIQTLSQKYLNNADYLVRIHIQILEAKDLPQVRDGSCASGAQSPNAFVKGTFFGSDVVTGVQSSTRNPTWNFAQDIIVASSEMNDSRECVVLRVHHCSASSSRPPLLGCLALRPPSPLWPGQVSLCGWYPLLNLKGNLAGHIKLSLTIVESLLNNSSSRQYPLAETRSASPVVCSRRLDREFSDYCITDQPRFPPSTRALPNLTVTEREQIGNTFVRAPADTKLCDDYVSESSEVPQILLHLQVQTNLKENVATETSRTDYCGAEPNDNDNSGCVFSLPHVNENIPTKDLAAIPETECCEIFDPPPHYADEFELSDPSLSLSNKESLKSLQHFQSLHNESPRCCMLNNGSKINVKYPHRIFGSTDNVFRQRSEKEDQFSQNSHDNSDTLPGAAITAPVTCDVIHDLSCVTSLPQYSNCNLPSLPAGFCSQSSSSIISPQYYSITSVPASRCLSYSVASSFEFSSEASTSLLQNSIINSTSQPFSQMSGTYTNFASNAAVSFPKKSNRECNLGDVSREHSDDTPRGLSRDQQTSRVFTLPSGSCLRTLDSPRGMGKKVTFAEAPFAAWCADTLSVASVNDKLVRYCESEAALLTGNVTHCRPRFYVSQDVEILNLEKSGHSKFALNQKASKDSDKRKERDGILCERRNVSPIESGKQDLKELLQTLSWMNIEGAVDSPCMSYIDTMKAPYKVGHNRSQLPDYANKLQVESKTLQSLKVTPVSNDGLVTAPRGTASQYLSVPTVDEGGVFSVSTSEPSVRDEPPTHMSKARQKRRSPSLCLHKSRIAANFSRLKT